MIKWIYFILWVLLSSCAVKKSTQKTIIAASQYKQKDSTITLKSTKQNTTIAVAKDESSKEDKKIIKYTFSQPTTIAEIEQQTAQVKSVEVIESQKHKQTHKKNQNQITVIEDTQQTAISRIENQDAITIQEKTITHKRPAYSALGWILLALFVGYGTYKVLTFIL